MSILTLVALPLVISENRKHQGDHPAAVAAVGLGGNVTGGLRSVAGSPAAGSTTTQPTGALVPVATPGASPTAAPASSPGTSRPEADTYASFNLWVPGRFGVDSPCQSAQAPFGKKVTITDLDNGHTTTCVVVGRPPASAGTTIVLGSDAFVHLADLVQAPVPVRVSW